MTHHTHIAHSITQTMRRWLPRAASIAAAAAATGDPARLLDLEAEQRGNDRGARGE